MAKIDPIISKGFKCFELISTSYHEASHTVFALLHWMRVNNVEVYEDDQCKRIQGLTQFDSLQNLEVLQGQEIFDKLLRAELGVSYSGLLGEKILFRLLSGSLSTPLFLSEGSSCDFKIARAIFRKYNIAAAGKSRAKYKVLLQREVQQELITHWSDITLLAHSLFEKRKLSYEDICLLLTKKSTNRKFWKEQFKSINNIFGANEEVNIQHLIAALK